MLEIKISIAVTFRVLINPSCEMKDTPKLNVWCALLSTQLISLFSVAGKQ